MKKTYIAPTCKMEFVQVENMIALSLQSGKADSTDALVKDGNDWGDIWDEASPADIDE